MSSTSPPLSPRSKKEKKEKAGGGGLFGDLLSYYYNSKASVGGAISGEVRLPDEQSVYILGRHHTGPNTTEWVRNQVACVSYFTYRNRLPVNLPGGHDHDAGWGCMIRTGQMMFLECLQNLMDRHREAAYIQKRSASNLMDDSSRAASATSIGAGGESSPASSSQRLFGVSKEVSAQNFVLAYSESGGKAFPATTDSGETSELSPPGSPTAKKSLRSLFMDKPEAPFGLHSLADAGARAHIKVGEWFNPTALSYALLDLVTHKCPMVAAVLEVVIARDGLLVRSEVLQALNGSTAESSQAPGSSSSRGKKGESANSSFAQAPPKTPKSVLVLIPLMLGAGGVIQPSYYQAICRCFHFSASLGIVGGKPKMSLYFVGHQANESVFYLDPHVVQAAYVSEETKGNTSGPRGTTKISQLDSCMLLCFIFHSVEEYLEWEHEFQAKINKLTEHPMFSIAEKRATVDDFDDMDFSESDDDEDNGEKEPEEREAPENVSPDSRSLTRGAESGEREVPKDDGDSLSLTLVEKEAAAAVAANIQRDASVKDLGATIAGVAVHPVDVDLDDEFNDSDVGDEKKTRTGLLLDDSEDDFNDDLPPPDSDDDLYSPTRASKGNIGDNSAAPIPVQADSSTTKVSPILTYPKATARHSDVISPEVDLDEEDSSSEGSLL